MSTSTTSTTSSQPVSEGGTAASQDKGGPQVPQTQQEAVKRAYSEATTALKVAHRDEFNADVKKRVESFGFTWSPRPTEAEKRVEALKALLAEDPSLAEAIKSGDLA